MLGYHYGFCSSVGGKTRRYASEWKKKGAERVRWDDGEGGRSRFEVQYVAADVIASLWLAALQADPPREERSAERFGVADRGGMSGG